MRRGDSFASIASAAGAALADRRPTAVWQRAQPRRGHGGCATHGRACACGAPRRLLSSPPPLCCRPAAAAEWRRRYGNDTTIFKWCRQGLPEEVPQLQQVGWPPAWGQPRVPPMSPAQPSPPSACPCAWRKAACGTTCAAGACCAAAGRHCNACLPYAAPDCIHRCPLFLQVLKLESVKPRPARGLTIVTQLSLERFQMLENQCSTWPLQVGGAWAWAGRAVVPPRVGCAGPLRGRWGAEQCLAAASPCPRTCGSQAALGRQAPAILLAATPVRVVACQPACLPHRPPLLPRPARAPLPPLPAQISAVLYIPLLHGRIFSAEEPQWNKRSLDVGVAEVGRAAQGWGAPPRAGVHTAGWCLHIGAAGPPRCVQCSSFPAHGAPCATCRAPRRASGSPRPRCCSPPPAAPARMTACPAPPACRSRCASGAPWRPPTPPASWTWRWWWRSGASGTQPCCTPPTPRATARSSTPRRVRAGGARAVLCCACERQAAGGRGRVLGCGRPVEARCNACPPPPCLPGAALVDPTIDLSLLPCNSTQLASLSSWILASLEAFEPLALPCLPTCPPACRGHAAGGCRLRCLPVAGQDCGGRGVLRPPDEHAARAVRARPPNPPPASAAWLWMLQCRGAPGSWPPAARRAALPAALTRRPCPRDLPPAGTRWCCPRLRRRTTARLGARWRLRRFARASPTWSTSSSEPTRPEWPCLEPRGPMLRVQRAHFILLHVLPRPMLPCCL